MNSKKTRFYRIFPALFLGGILVFSGCEKSNDLYNPDHLQEEAKKAFPVKDIDPNQTWETSAICNASVTVNEKSGGTYTIKVYTENPYNTNGNAYLLAKTSVADGQTANFKFDIPATLQYVYVMKVNEKGYSSAIPVAVENGSMKVAFGETGTTRATATRADGNQFFAPEKPNDKTFPTTAPTNCGDINNYWERLNNIPYLLNEGTYDYINAWKGADLYIQGNVTINSVGVPGSGSTLNFYLLPNATVTIKETFDHSSNSIFSIGTGAKLIANNMIGESGSKFFNRGTITSSSTIKLIDAYFYNQGAIETDKVIFTNPNAKFCNASGGKLSVNSFSIVGDGHFLNETDAVVNCKGRTELTCTNGSWENAGHFTTSTMHMYAWNNSIKNSCWLTVLDELKFNDSGVYNESYIECNTLDINNTSINMAAESFFVVKEQAVFRYNPYERGFGFNAPTTGKKAVLKIKRAIRNGGSENIAYNGQLFVACNDHFEIQKDASNVYYRIKNGAELSGTDNADIKIPASTCNPGYNSTPDGGGEKDKVIEYAYAFEDMMVKAGDYDFNDVVLFVTTPYKKDGKLVIDATLKAAGATKKLKVLFKNGTTTTTLFENAHTALGVSEGTIVNTGATTGTPSTVTIEVGENFNLTNNGDFYISDGQREIHIPNFTTGFKAGDAPYALRIAQANWKWPKEQIQITEAYPDFANWANDATQAPDWYNNFNSGKVMGIE